MLASLLRPAPHGGQPGKQEPVLSQGLRAHPRSAEYGFLRDNPGLGPASEALCQLPGPHTMVMTLSAAGWNLRIFLLRALEALMRHNLGIGGRGGLRVPGALEGCGGQARGQAPTSESLLLDSRSPKRLVVWSLAPSSLVSATVE